MWGGYMNYNKCTKINPQVSLTIMSRDYKGFGTSKELSNGVIVGKREEN